MLGLAQLNSKTYILYLMGACAFILGYCYLAFLYYVLISTMHQKLKNSIDCKIQLNQYNKFKFVIKLFILFGLVGYCINVFQAMHYSLNGPGNVFFNLRYSNTVLSNPYYGSHLLLFLDVATIFLIILREYLGVSLRLITFLSIICLSCFLFTVARTNILLSVVAISSSWYLSTKYVYKIRANYRIFLLMGVIFLIIFFLVAAVTNKVKITYLNTFLEYLGYPIIAFDKHIVEYAGIGSGNTVFYPLFKFFSIIDNDISVANPINIPPGYFNVCSAIHGPYLDYGTYGILFAFFTFGCIYRLIYMQVRRGNIWYIGYYCFVLFPLVMSFYAYTYSYPLWIYYLMIFILIYCLSNILKVYNIRSKPGGPL
jgi:oligosaccharide repeat unit polymerase